MVGNVIIAGGLATMAGSIYDSSQNKTLNEENGIRLKITRELSDTYGIKTECAHGQEPFAVVCRDYVEGEQTREEEEQILAMHREELGQKLSKVPTDPEANARGLRDGLGTLGGLVVAAVGVAIRPSKERGG